MLDDGACRALTMKGKSLLPSGITSVSGEFGAGDSVECCNSENEVLAVGLINYSAADIQKIKGVHSDMIEVILGYKDSDEVMHRDNLVVLH
jgi:glutamate 5-kinase